MPSLPAAVLSQCNMHFVSYLNLESGDDPRMGKKEQSGRQRSPRSLRASGSSGLP